MDVVKRFISNGITYELSTQDTLTIGTIIYNFDTNEEDIISGYRDNQVRATAKGRRFHPSAHALGGGWKAVKKVENKNDKTTPSCYTCYYSSNGKNPCDRHVNKLKPDYTKGVECAYNNYVHYIPFKSADN